MSAVDVVQRQLDAYNAQDLDAFCACFADDCVIERSQWRRDTARHAPQSGSATRTCLRTYPENHAVLVNRIVVGDVVIDHEDITRSPSERTNATAIYTVKDGLIARVDFVRAP